MGLYLRDADVRQLRATLDTCLTPAAFGSADSWRMQVEHEVRTLLQGDHVVFAIPIRGAIDVHATNVTPNAVKAMGDLFARIPEIPADPVLNQVEAYRIEHRLEVWTRVGVYLDAMRGRGRRRAGDCTFFGEVLGPSLMRDSENIDFTTDRGHTALCVSYERGQEYRRVGGGVARSNARALLRILLPALKCGVAALSAPADAAAPPTWSAEDLVGAFGLTPREAVVALLLLRRASNREIAAALGLSAHTVRHHVEHIFLKLDVTSRREIAGRLSRHPQVGVRAGQPS